MKLRLATVPFKRCPHVQQTMPSLQYDKACLALRLESVSSNSKQFDVAHVLNHPFWLWTERVVGFDFVVDLVEEHVGLGGSQFSESILERWYSAHASQRNVEVLEFGSPCSPRSALFAHEWIVWLQRVRPVHRQLALVMLIDDFLPWLPLAQNLLLSVPPPWVNMRVLVVQVCDQFVQAMRNSDPRERIVLVHRLISDFHLPCKQQGVTSNTGPILVFPRIQPFGSDDFSSLGKVYSRHATA